MKTYHKKHFIYDLQNLLLFPDNIKFKNKIQTFKVYKKLEVRLFAREHSHLYYIITCAFTVIENKNVPSMT